MYFINSILDWYHQNKRDLPWRVEATPYHVWISEIILQQTRVNQGLDYYLRFIAAFPTVKDLANAEEQEVLNLWKGLGYYSRARNIHKAAKSIMAEYNGELPFGYEDLKKLSGIGPYTAAAIASIAFNEPVPAIDGNAYRVYSRYLGIYDDIAMSKTFKVFFEAGLEMISKESPGDFNQAIMELGATACLPQNPLCMFCPVQENCYAFNNGKIELLPVKTKKVKVKNEHIEYVYIYCGNQFLLNYRETKGIWQNMYDFLQKKEITNFIKEELNPNYSVNHILTHKRLNIDFITLKVGKEEFNKIKKEFNLKVANSTIIDEFPTPKPITDFINKNIK